MTELGWQKAQRGMMAKRGESAGGLLGAQRPARGSAMGVAAPQKSTDTGMARGGAPMGYGGGAPGMGISPGGPPLGYGVPPPGANMPPPAPTAPVGPRTLVVYPIKADPATETAGAGKAAATLAAEISTLSCLRVLSGSVLSAFAARHEADPLCSAGPCQSDLAQFFKPDLLVRGRMTRTANDRQIKLELVDLHSGMILYSSSAGVSDSTLEKQMQASARTMERSLACQ